VERPPHDPQRHPLDPPHRGQWREPPERYGEWKSVHGRLTRWRADGTIDRILERLQRRLDEPGRIDHDLWCVDATSIRAGRAAAGAGGGKVAGEPDDHALVRSRGGFGTEPHLVADGDGLPRSAVVTAGQAHESKSWEPVLEAVRLKRAGRGRPRRPGRLAGDEGYSDRRARRCPRSRGIVAVIPTRTGRRRNPHSDEEAYRRRDVVERCVARLKEKRRLATRHEKLAVNFLAMVKLAMIRRRFKAYDSPDRT
jgi:transposase